MLEYIFTSLLLFVWIVVTATIVTLSRWLSGKYHWAYGSIGIIAGFMAYLCVDYFAQNAIGKMNDDITKGLISTVPLLLFVIFSMKSFAPNKVETNKKVEEK